MYISIEEYEDTKAFLAKAEQTVAKIQATINLARRQFTDENLLRELDHQQDALDARMEHLICLQNQLSGFVN